MASSSYSFFVVSVALLLQFLVASASSTKYIDKLCQMQSINNKTFCLQTLRDYSYDLAGSAKGLLPLASAVILGIVLPQAQNSAGFARGAGAIEREPSLKIQLKTCEDAYLAIGNNLMSAFGELTEDPMTANYDTMVCYDQTTIVINQIGKNKDVASKTLMEMTTQILKLIPLAVAATEVVGG